MNPAIRLQTPSIATLVAGMARAGKLTLPPLPDVALRVGEMLRREDADPRTIAELISNEPAIAAAVIRMANAASFAGLRPVEEVDGAVARLGMRQVAAVVTAVAHKGHFEGRDPAHFALLRTLWDHAVSTAAAARHLASSAGADTAESFLAGLLHDVGKLVVVKAVDVLGTHGGATCTPPVLAELMELLHAELGHDVLVTWKLPRSICLVAKMHHAPAPEPQDHLLLRVQAADAISRKMGFHPSPAPDLDLADVPAIERLAIGDLELASLMVDVEDEMSRLQTML